MRIQILCSTMYGRVPLFFEKNKGLINSIIINQCINKNNEVDGFINVYEKGLSKSRNKALKFSDADICIVSDNDVYYHENIKMIIEKAFQDYPDADVITFQIQTPEGEMYKEYSSKFCWHNKLSLAKVSSVEIAFRRNSILEKDIKFDEKFGLGSIYPTSEEYIFLVDCLNHGLKIAYVPEIIVFHPKESSGGNFSDDNLVIAKGAMIHRIFGIKGFLISLVFAFKKFKYSGKSFFYFTHKLLSGFFKHKKDM